MTNSLCSSAALVFLSAVVLLLPGLHAADADSPPGSPAAIRSGTSEELLIANGVFTAPRGGRTTPATLRNLVDAITQRHRQANITIVGVDDILIRELRLRWGKSPLVEDTNVENVPLRGMLTALREASGRQFELQVFGENDFVLSAIGAGASGSRVEVFNLNSMPAARESSHLQNHLQKELTRLEAEMPILAKRLPADHPRLADHVLAIEMTKANIAQTSKQTDDVAKRIEQIQEVVDATLRYLHRGRSTPSPNFKYHPGTGLLVVVGNEQALEVTRKVIAALN